MTDYKIISDSACDLPKSLIEKYDIGIIPFYVSFGDDTYYKEYEELYIDEFYKTLRTKPCRPKTSMPTVNDFSLKFEKWLKEGMDILCICLTSKFSGAIGSAHIAATSLMEKYPERKIIVVDSILASMIQGAFVIEAAKMKEKGFTIEDNYKALEEIKHFAGAVVTVDTLEYLKIGGRIGKVSAIAGQILNIKPLIQLDDGELIPIGKIRTRKKAVDKIIDVVLDINKDSMDITSFFVLNADVYDEGIELAKKFKDITGLTYDIPVYDIGTTIGAHIGPTVLGIGYVRIKV